MTGLVSSEQKKQFFSDNLFKYIFGRKPNPKSDRSVLLNYLTSIEKTPPELLQNMLECGFSNGQIAAIYETGIVPTEADFQEYPPTLVQLWLSISYGETKKTSRVERRLSPRVMKDPYGAALTRIYTEINNTIMRLSHVMDTSLVVARHQTSHDLFFYYLSRTLQILRSIRVLVNNDENGILTSLSRNLFECFVHLKFLNERPDIAKDLILPALVDNETLAFSKNSAGKVERRSVKNLKTGEITRTHYSIREILRLCKDTDTERLYDAWYPELSCETHITAELLGDHFANSKFSIHREVDDDFALVNLGFGLALVVNEIAISRTLTKVHSRDVRFGCKRLCGAIQSICKIFLPHVPADNSAFECILQSMDKFTNSVLDNANKAKSRADTAGTSTTE